MNEVRILINKMMGHSMGKETFFSTTRRKFHSYWETLKKFQDTRLTVEINNFSNEALTRFSQLDILLSKIELLDKSIEIRRLESIGKKPIRTQWVENINSIDTEFEKFPTISKIVDSFTEENSFDQMKELELFCETFYYIAHRLLKIIKNYPGLTGFKKANGVTIVRNHLIEHSDGKDGISFPSFAIGNLNGPVIKAMRTECNKDISVDVGLYKNAEEFRDNLNKVLQVAFEGLSNNKIV